MARARNSCQSTSRADELDRHRSHRRKNAEVFGVGDTSPQPTGSTIKLYVLGAVATAVENGTLSWDQKLTVTDDLKSMPGGTMQDLPSGTEVTVRETAG